MENFAHKTNKLMSESILFIEDLCLDLKKRNYDVAAFIEIKKNIEKLKENFDKREVFILFLGEVSTGKSSLINCILGERLLVVEERSCTNTITHIKYGKKEVIEVHFQPLEDGSEIPPKVINRSDLPMYTSERHNKDNHKNVAYVMISTPNEFLKGGVNLFDAPGVGSMNPLHTFTTFSIAKKADAVFYISTPIREFNECDINNIKRISEHTQGCEFAHILTKKDQGNPKLILEKNKGHMRNLLGNKAVQYFMVSNEWYKNYLDNKDERNLKYSGFSELFAYLGNIAQNKDKILSQRYLTVLTELFNPILADLKELCGYITNPANNKRIQELEALRRRLNELLSEGHPWQRNLNAGMESIQNELKRQLADDSSQLKIDVNDMLEELDSLRHLDELNDKIVLKMNKLMFKYDSLIKERLNSLTTKLLQEMKLDEIHQSLNFVEMDSTDKNYIGTNDNNYTGKTFGNAFNYGCKALLGLHVASAGLMGVGMAVGAVGETVVVSSVANSMLGISAALVNPIVAGVAIVASAIWGIVKSRQKAKEEVIKKINVQIDGTFKNLWEEIKKSLKNGGNELKYALKELIKKEIKSCDSKIHNIQTGVKQDLSIISSYGNRGKSLFELIKKEMGDGKQ